MGAVSTHSQYESNNASQSKPVATKLRCLGLSNPKNGIKQALKAFENPHALYDLAESTSNEAVGILGGEKREGTEAYLSQVFLATDNFIKHQSDDEDGLILSGYPFPFNTGTGFIFCHGIVAKKGNSEDMIGAYFIDHQAVAHTQGDIGDKMFSKLEKAIGSLALLSNHDYTMHRYGMFRNNFESFLGSAAILGGGRFSIIELMAAIFQKDMLQEGEEIGVGSIELAKKSVDTALEIISTITKPDLKKYWLSVLKYFIFSIFSPEDSYLQKFRAKYPDLNLGSTNWGEELAQGELEFNIDGERYTLGVREARECIMDLMRREDPNAIEKFTNFVKKTL